MFTSYIRPTSYTDVHVRAKSQLKETIKQICIGHAGEYSLSTIYTYLYSILSHHNLTAWLTLTYPFLLNRLLTDVLVFHVRKIQSFPFHRGSPDPNKVLKTAPDKKYSAVFNAL